LKMLSNPKARFERKGSPTVIQSDALALASMVVALVALGVSVYSYVKTGPSRALSRIHLGREDAKLQLNLIREKLVSLSKEIEESKQKGWKLSSVQSRTFGRNVAGRYWLTVMLVRAYECYPMMSPSELFGLILDGAFFEDKGKVFEAIERIDRLLSTL